MDCVKYLGWQVAADGGCEKNVVHRMNGRVPYSQKGVDGGSKWRAGTRETEVRLDERVKVALGNRGMTVEVTRQFAKERKEWRALEYL